MQKLNPTVQVILTICLIAAVTISGIRFLMGHDLDLFGKKTVRYFALFEQVGDLQINSPVKMNGREVGTVDRLEPGGLKLSKIRVTIKLAGDMEIPANSVAYVQSSLFDFGSPAIVIEKGTSRYPLNKEQEILTTDRLSGSFTDSAGKHFAREFIHALAEFAKKQDSVLNADSAQQQK